MSEFTPATADIEPPATAAEDPDVDDEVFPGSDDDGDPDDLPCPLPDAAMGARP